MDKISKLLEETQNLLECFSGGTLSPVSSYCNSDAEPEDEPEFRPKSSSSSSSEFRKVLRKFTGGDFFKFIENWKIPKMALHICVEEGCKDLEIYKALLRAGCNPLELDFDRKTALTLLLEQKEADIKTKIEEMVAEEDRCLISTLLGEWELRRAATNESQLFKLIHSRNWKDLYEFLQQENPEDPARIIYKPDPKYAGISPLHDIAATNDVIALKKLLNKFKGSIDLNVKAIGSGNTPLHEASHMSATEMVGLLLESGARSNLKNAAGKIPAHLGTEKIQVLIEFHKMSDTNSGLSVNKAKSTSKELSSKKAADLFVQATKSASSESLSREERKLKQIIGFLDQIEKHKDENATAETAETEKEGKRAKLIDLETILQRESHTGRTILHRYARRNQSEKLIIFLRTQELTSTQCKDLKVFEVIDNSGHTPLHDAAAEGSLETAKIFLFGGRTAKVKNLLIDPSIPATLTGDTPLHAAAAAGNVEIVELLLEVGAKKDAVNIEGKKAVDVTISKSIKKLLETRATEQPIAAENKAAPGSTIKPTEHQLIPMKRGPGRPRKYPRPIETTLHSSAKTKEIIRSPSKLSQAHPPLPLNELFHDKSNCIILVKFEDEWLMLEEHFSSIYQHLLAKQHTHHTTDEIDQIRFRPASQSERTEISKLPRLGNLIEVLQVLNSSPLSFIPKGVATQIFEKEFDFTLTGPFGYIDIPKIRGTAPASDKLYGGCPLKLKMKLGKDFDSGQTAVVSSLHLLAAASFNLELPKSPKTLQM